MPKTKSQSTKKRVKVGSLPSKAKKLTGKDAKRVKGGIGGGEESPKESRLR
jgi:hypothetical protein